MSVPSASSSSVNPRCPKRIQLIIMLQMAQVNVYDCLQCISADLRQLQFNIECLQLNCAEWRHIRTQFCRMSAYMILLGEYRCFWYANYGNSELNA